MPLVNFQLDKRFKDEHPENITWAVQKAYGGEGQVPCPGCGQMLVAEDDHGRFRCFNPACTRSSDRSSPFLDALGIDVDAIEASGRALLDQDS